MSCILVVDDIVPNLDLTRYLLEAAGHVVITARDGGKALSLALGEAVDLILCDLQMPVFDGFELLRRLQNDGGWRRVPVIALTAFSMAGDRERCLAAGFDGYLSKPIEARTFAAQIAAYLPARTLGAVP